MLSYLKVQCQESKFQKILKTGRSKSTFSAVFDMYLNLTTRPVRSLVYWISISKVKLVATNTTHEDAFILPGRKLN